jgi:hypothetical protein
VSKPYLPDFRSVMVMVKVLSEAEHQSVQCYTWLLSLNVQLLIGPIGSLCEQTSLTHRTRYLLYHCWPCECKLNCPGFLVGKLLVCDKDSEGGAEQTTQSFEYFKTTLY